MDTSTVITLVTETFTADSIGQRVGTETQTTVMARTSSIGSSEFFSAGQNGIKPELKVTMFAPNYDGQRIVIYNNVRYSVYRTYTKGDNIELYLEKRTGA